jgi:hypothetical protein
MLRYLTPIICLILSLAAVAAEQESATNKSEPNAPSPNFAQILAKYRDLPAADFLASLPKRPYLEKLTFDPVQAKFYQKVDMKLRLDSYTKELLRNNGFVVLDQSMQSPGIHGEGFGNIYYSIYSADLPVFITTDSILYALHRSYEDILIEIEGAFLREALEKVLTGCHDALAPQIKAPMAEAQNTNYRDVDLYLTVALNLMRGAGAPATNRLARPNLDDFWEGRLLVNSKTGIDQEVLQILKNIQSLKMQDPVEGEFTQIYGGRRAIDYTQFRPRSHYTKNALLSRYFRAMMWLGRADTGFNVLPPDKRSMIDSNSRRELRDAVLLTELLNSNGTIKYLEQMNRIIEFIVGGSDNLTPFAFAKLLEEQKIKSLTDITGENNIALLEEAIRSNKNSGQQIASQVIFSPWQDNKEVSPPAMFQLFGQRYIIDSFVLSEVVFDQILFHNVKMQRWMPSGLDVAFALGNNEAAPLLEADLTQYQYAANLKASQEFISTRQESFWRANLYNIWLDALRTLHEIPNEGYFPEAMRTKAWQLKQLQTQLASWSELRHDTVLYAKQSYSKTTDCEYPTGYVEPYPRMYANIKTLCEEAARRIEGADFTLGADSSIVVYQRKQVVFLKNMAEIIGRLEKLASKELAGEAFSQADQLWLKQTINIHRADSGTDTYSGWYCQLFYGGSDRAAAWSPSIADVHTAPKLGMVLEVGKANCELLVIAIDNQDDRMVYVGPVYTYCEFSQPASDRLTDEQWRERLRYQPPPRPIWSESIRASGKLSTRQ